jgi:hypothetical protein
MKPKGRYASFKIPDRCPDDRQTIPPCNLNLPVARSVKEWNKGNFEKYEKGKKMYFPVGMKTKTEAKIAFYPRGKGMLQRLCDMGLTPVQK